MKKFQQHFRKVKDEMSGWDDLQSRLISQFMNASSIIGRLQAIQNSKNYGSLSSIQGIEGAVLQKQMDSLQSIFLSMKKTMEEFRQVVLYLEKIQREGKQLAIRSSNQATKKQLNVRTGIKPSLADCLDGLKLLHEMHHSEYLLKSSLVSALSTLAVKPDTSDLGALSQLLVDQPNIPKEEVENIFEIIFAEEIC